MISAPKPHHPNHPRLHNIMSPPFWTAGFIPSNPHRKNANRDGRADHDKPPMVINPESPDKSGLKDSDSDDHTEDKTTTGNKEKKPERSGITTSRQYKRMWKSTNEHESTQRTTFTIPTSRSRNKTLCTYSTRKYHASTYRFVQPTAFGIRTS